MVKLDKVVQQFLQWALKVQMKNGRKEIQGYIWLPCYIVTRTKSAELQTLIFYMVSLTWV